MKSVSPPEPAQGLRVYAFGKSFRYALLNLENGACIRRKSWSEGHYLKMSSDQQSTDVEYYIYGQLIGKNSIFHDYDIFADDWQVIALS